MKKILVFLQKGLRRPLVLCYSVYVLWTALGGLYGFAADSLLRASGQLATTELSVADFTPVNLEQEGEGWRSTAADPQLLYQVDGRVTTVRVFMSFDADPGELDLYYIEQPGEDYDKYRRVWAVQQDDGSYLYQLPRADIWEIRLDPGSAENLGINITEIRINEPVGIGFYFDLSLNGLFRLIVWPALAAAVLAWLTGVWDAVRKKQKEKPESGR